MGYSLGVDLGTGYTAAAVSWDGQVEAVPLGDRADYVPSVIYRSPKGELSFGEPAERHAAAEPERMAREFKQRIGAVRRGASHDDSDAGLIIGDASVSAEELSREFLVWVLERVEDGQGAPPEKLIICHPAPWKQFQREAWHDVAAVAGEIPVEFCTEPEAAAIHFASSRQMPDDGTVAVYDLGTGTFDVAILRRTRGGRFELLGQPLGLPECGGLHFDDELFRWVLHATDNEDLDFDDPAVFSAVKRLRRECVDAKEALSSETEVSISVSLPGSSTKVRLTRTEFEDLIRPLVAATVDRLQDAIDAAGVDAEDLAAVVLAGGSARTPLVKEMVVAHLGRPVTLSPKPKLCVAMGAALIGDPLAHGSAPVDERPSVTSPTPRSKPAAGSRSGTPLRKKDSNGGKAVPKTTVATTGVEPRAARATTKEHADRAEGSGLLARVPRLSWYRYTTLGLLLLAVILALAGPVVAVGSGRYTWNADFAVSAPRLPDKAQVTVKVWGVSVPGLDPVVVTRGGFSLLPYRFVLGGPVGGEVIVGPGRASVELAPERFTIDRFLNVGSAALVLSLMFSFAYVTSLLQGLRRRKRAASPSEVLGLGWAGAVVGFAIVLAAWIVVGRRLDIGVAAVIVMLSALAGAFLGVGRTFARRE